MFNCTYYYLTYINMISPGLHYLPTFSASDIGLGVIIALLLIYILISLYLFKKSDIREFVSKVASNIFDMILKTL